VDYKEETLTCDFMARQMMTMAKRASLKRLIDAIFVMQLSETEASGRVLTASHFAKSGKTRYTGHTWQAGGHPVGDVACKHGYFTDTILAKTEGVRNHRVQGQTI